MEEKYGFVYIWRDRNRKKYYIGCHWGREDDGYICSSNWMRDAYRYRPQDFKRRIIKRIYTNRKDLLEEEYRYLQMIPEHYLGSKYYNLSRNHPNHWSTNPRTRKSISERNSERMKLLHQDPEYKKIFKEGRKKSAAKLKKTLAENPEIKLKQVKKMRETLAIKFPAESKKYPIAKRNPYTGEYTAGFKFRLQEGVDNYWNNLTEEERKAVAERKSKQAKKNIGFYKANVRKGLKNSKEHNDAIVKANGKQVSIDGVSYPSMSKAGKAVGLCQVTVANRCRSDKWPTWCLN